MTDEPSRSREARAAAEAALVRVVHHYGLNRSGFGAGCGLVLRVGGTALIFRPGLTALIDRPD